MSNATDFRLPDFTMHGARSVIALARRPEYFEQQVMTLEKAVNEQPSLAIDLSKSLIETICNTILNDHKHTIDRHWELHRLLKEALTCLKLVPDHIQNQAEVEASLRKTTGSLQSVVQGICEIRNREGFASHGRDGYVQSLDIMHAEFIARSTDAVVSFLYKSHFKDQIQPRRMEYGDNQDFNDWIDDRNGFVFIFYQDAGGDDIALDYSPSEVLFNVDQDAYKESMAAHQSIANSSAPNPNTSTPFAD